MGLRRNGYERLRAVTATTANVCTGLLLGENGSGARWAIPHANMAGSKQNRVRVHGKSKANQQLRAMLAQGDTVSYMTPNSLTHSLTDSLTPNSLTHSFTH